MPECFDLSFLWLKINDSIIASAEIGGWVRYDMILLAANVTCREL